MRSRDVDEFTEQLFLFRQAIGRFSTACSLEDKINSALQMEALAFLGLEQGSSVSALASHLRTSLSSATQLTERLVKSGLVDRRHDQADRRVVTCSITEAGRQELVRMRGEMRAKLEKVLAVLPEHELSDLVRIMRALTDGLSTTTTTDK